MSNIYLLRYKWRTGMVAWLLHRLTGLGLIFYLTLHIFVTRGFQQAATIADPALRAQEFNAIYSILTHPLFGMLEIGLLAAVLYHAINGIRVLIVDFFGGARYHKQLWFGLMAVFAVLMIVFGGMMLLHVLHGAGGVS